MSQVDADHVFVFSLQMRTHVWLRQLTPPGLNHDDLMMANKIKRVPVLSGEKLVGIARRTGITRAIALGKHIAMHTPMYDL